MRANIKEVFASPIKLLLSMEEMVKLLNPKIIGMRNYYARRFARPWLWKIEKYINSKFTRWYNRKKQRNYRPGNAAKIRELTLQAGLASICGWMLKEEEYRKVVCGKTARTVWWGDDGNPTVLLYRSLNLWFYWLFAFAFNLSTREKGEKCVCGNKSTIIFEVKLELKNW